MIPLHPLAAVVRSICDRNREFYSDRRGIGALKDLQQTFPNPWLYVAELVQNAIDAGATRIASTPGADGTLVFEHDGAPFTESDVESLCMRGVSSKGAGTVGFMGIGFKSVFRSFQRVEIASAEWRFALTVDVRAGVRFGDNQRDWLGAVLPEWDDAVEPPSEGMTCRFRLSRRLAELPATEEDLDRVLGSDSSLLALLAWQGVIELGWNGQQWVLERREFPIGAGADQRVELTSIDGDGITLRRWVLFSTKYQPSDRAIARFLEHRQLTPPPEDQPRVYEEASRARRVAVFCEIDQDGDPQTVERGSAFALLPTGVSFPLGLHVQADWLLVVSRRELMQIEGNEWHEEILRQLPQLLRNFLLWLVDTPWPDGSVRHRGYDALPGESSGDREPDQWFEGEEFREAMSVCLADLPFLPVPPEEGGPVTFITPRQGCRLPQPLATHFKDDDVSHRVLFGNHTFSSALLGDRALRYLVELQLLTYLSAEQLAAEWENGVVASWYTRLDEGRRDQALGGLLNALAELDHDDKWRGAKLLCLPTEAGGWTVRGDAVRYPSDWAVLAQEGDIRDALEPLVGDPERTVRWSFDRAVYQPRSTGAKYLEPLVPSKLESLADRWWASLPSHPDAEQVRVVLRFTSWVRAKQPNRKNLVRKLLAMDPAGQMSLRPTQEVLVAAPYADDCRKTWFTGLPVISADYAGQDSQATPGDWRTFFESLVPAPQGRFTLRLTTGDHDSASLKSLVGDDYLPPSLRASYKQVAWRALTVDSTHYKVLDAELPLLLSEKLASHAGMTPEDSRSLVTWISESPNMLREYSARKIAYIAYGEGTVTERPIDIDSSWKRDLQERSWAFTVANTGPYPPREVLAEPDPARPDAPVAALPPDFLRLLREVGIDFGSDIPDAPHVLRLRVQGPSAPVEELLRLAKAAATEARSDAGKREYLKETLLATNLFPLPSGRVSPDRLSRVSLDRVVRTERGRSTFGSWLAVADSHPVGSPERQLFELATAIVDIPETATGDQALAFLSWVWRTKPDAERVRGVLPRAYQYAREDSADRLASLQKVLATAVVYATGKRQWIQVADESVFLNDFPEGEVPPEQIDVALATPGHLAEERADQIAVAEMISLKLLSSRFRVDTLATNPIAVPALWQRMFTRVQQDLLGCLKPPDSAEEEESRHTRPQFALSRWGQIETVVFDRGIESHRSPRQATILNGTLAVTGQPEEFAEAVCQILFNAWNLSKRRDLVNLIPKVAIDLSRIGDERFALDPQPTGTSEEALQPDEPEEDTDGGEDTEEDKDENIEEEEIDEDDMAGDDAELLESDTEEDTLSVRPPGSGRRLKRKRHRAVDRIPAPEQSETNDGRGHTAKVRESIIKTLLRQLREITSTGVAPAEDGNSDDTPKRTFQSDKRFRDAVVEYERNHGRIPRIKDDAQEGHDIDSYVAEAGTHGGKLLRRIEVKGKGVPWTGEEIVELSDRQYSDAANGIVEPGVILAADFDYWLYVVEGDGSGQLTVLPIRNPAKQAAHYEFRAGTWRHLVEVETVKKQP